MAQLTLTPAQRTRLIKIIAHHPDVANVSHRLNFLENIGLKEEQGKIALGDTADHFAYELIRLCEWVGILPATQQPALVNVILYLREDRKGNEEDRAFLDSLLVQDTTPSPGSSPLSHDSMMDMFTAALDHRRAKEWDAVLSLLRELQRQRFETFMDLDALIKEAETEREKIIRRQRMSKEYEGLARIIRDFGIQQARAAWDNFCKRHPEFNFITDLPPDYLYPPTLEQQRLLDIMLDIRIPPPQRAEAGRELSKIGDPRRGVGVLPNGIPDIVWCDVPNEGKVVLGKDSQAYQSLDTWEGTIEEFRIGKYPITYQQFQVFIEALDGFRNSQWWNGLKQPDSPGDQAFTYAAHPRERVSWYEAIAFCRWLGMKLKRDENAVRLPTEKEWEKAARWNPRTQTAQVYPWPGEYVSGYANIDETYEKKGQYNLQTTSAVGGYPKNASPYSVMDMAGNVWEWTTTDYQTTSDDIMLTSTARVLRGGSWVGGHSYARSASRFYGHPGGRFNNIGFRVVLVVAPSRTL